MSYRQTDDRRNNRRHPSQGKRDLQEQADFNNKRLFYGFGNSLSAVIGDFSLLQNTVPVVPVTTRAIGFYTQYIFKKVYELYGRRKDRIPNCTPYAFYRVSLAQLEYRLLCANYSQINTTTIDEGLFYCPRLTIEEREVVRSMAETFSPLVNLIDGVGPFDFKGEPYYVKCPRDEVLGILYSNLKTVVERMANPATPHDERQTFYDLNPLPFADWNRPQLAGGHPLLLNPEDFAPTGYDIEAFEKDVNQVRHFISSLSREEIKMVFKGEYIDYKTTGHQRVLISNDAQGLRNPDRMYQNQWAEEGLPTGDLDYFWTPVTVTSQDFFMGVMNLVGERRQGVGDAFAFRSPLIAQGVSKHRWTSLVRMLG